MIWWIIKEVVFPALVIMLSGYIAWVFTMHWKVRRLVGWNSLRTFFKRAREYSQYVYSGGFFRRLLFSVVVMSFVFVLFFNGGNNKFIENMAFSIIAAFIFDLFLNFQKEHLAKCMISRKWHSKYYSSHERRETIIKAFWGERAIPFEVKEKTLHILIFRSIFDSQLFRLKQSISSTWSSDSFGLKMLELQTGALLNDVVLNFLREDAAFINSFYLDDKVTSYFPGLNSVSRRFNNDCLITLNMVETKLGLQRSWYANDVQIIDSLRRYLESRKVFMREYGRCLEQYGV